MTRAGLLHTVPALAGTFESAIVAERPALELVHIADASLLATAIREGITPAVRARVARHIGALADAGAEAVLVTCSSIGEAVESAAVSASIPVIRVDAAMADEAVGIAVRAAGGERGGRISVLATLEATLEPTSRLLERAAVTAAVAVDAAVVPHAADRRTSGDLAEHNRLIADAVRAAQADADVIVLAQASMADAVDARTTVPVLTSPAGGIAALLRTLESPNED